MSKPSFTPGPWRTDEFYDAVLSDVIKDDGQDDVVCSFDYGNKPDDEQIANAHLISAAPELYEALAEMCANFTSGNPDQREAIARAREALDKARGEQP